MHHRLSLRTLTIVLIWLAVWQTASMIVANDILLAGPADVIRSLFMQFFTQDFWISAATSCSKILYGFFLAFFGGILLGSLSFRFPLLQEILEPPLLLMKSVPVASFVILALIWAGSENLSVFISFFVVFPILYVNTRSGLASTDPELLEMANVFQLSLFSRIRFLYLPALFPYLSNGCRVALGMGWKSGIAAEVIGVPSRTIGEHLYMAKIYLATADLFAWTLAIILICLFAEQIFLKILELAEKFNRHVSHIASTSLHPSDSAISAAPASPAAAVSHLSLEIQNLCKSFDGHTVLSDFSLELSSGRIFCLMAPSGSGKTTLFRILLGLDSADSGSITLSNQMPVRFSAVFQEDRLCEEFCALDNVMFVSHHTFSRQDAYQALCTLLPSEAILRPVSTLSGGQKRRVALCRALLAPSSVLLMDEPFTGLDEATRMEVIHFLKPLVTKKVLLISTHQTEDAKALGASVIHLPGNI